MKTIVLLCLLLIQGISHAEFAVIPLQHRTAEQVLRAVQPHLGEDAQISSIGSQLIISAPPGHLARLKALLSAIDIPPRQFLITVRRGSEDRSEARGAGLSGRTDGTQAGTRWQGRIWSTRALGDAASQQQVRVLEDTPALIQTGQSIPIRLKQVIFAPQGHILSETLVYRDLQSGFEATPSVVGKTVTLQIQPYRETPTKDLGGVIQREVLSTTVSGKLGEWIALGGDTSSETGAGSGYVTYSTRELRRQGQVMLKVDEVGD